MLIVINTHPPQTKINTCARTNIYCVTVLIIFDVFVHFSSVLFLAKTSHFSIFYEWLFFRFTPYIPIVTKVFFLPATPFIYLQVLSSGAQHFLNLYLLNRHFEITSQSCASDNNRPNLIEYNKQRNTNLFNTLLTERVREIVFMISKAWLCGKRLKSVTRLFWFQSNYVAPPRMHFIILL